LAVITKKAIVHSVETLRGLIDTTASP